MAESNTLRGKFEVLVKGNKYPCHLSMNAFRLLCEREYLKFEEMQTFMQDKPLSAVPKVIYCGMLNAAHMKGKTEEDLPKFELVSAYLLQDQKSLETYTDLIGKAFSGEDEQEEGNE